MPPSRVLEQHIAVFGESGSGKTVMLSSFYGSEQESENVRPGLFNLIAEDPGQGVQLHQNYLGMKKSAIAPDATKLASTAYRFALRFKGESPTGRLRGRPFEALRLVWHDYPGEWFEQDVSGPTEAQRRIDTFRRLLESQVALVLVDGARLLDNQGEEERYLKSLFGNLRNSLLLLKDELLEEQGRLVTFPRIWVISLSKADLHPDLDVQAFKELVVEKAGADIVQLREVLAEVVESGSALSVGEDFLRFSSARFGPDKIEVTRRVGLDLILPIAAILPFERHVRWAKAGTASRKVAAQLLGRAELVAVAAGAASRLIAALASRQGRAAGVVGIALSRLTPNLESLFERARDRVQEADQSARSKHENLALTLERYRDELAAGERTGVLIRSSR